MTSTSATETDTVDLAPKEIVQNAVDLKGTPTHILIALHGIRDNGLWALEAEQELYYAGSTVRIQAIRHSWFSEWKFLFQSKPYKTAWQVQKELRRIFKDPVNKDIPISILCHSNGTKILAMILEAFDYEFKYIFLTGSICRNEFSSLFEGAATDWVVNFCGRRDVWSIVAEILRPSCNEATGVFGMTGARVRNLFFDFCHNGGVQPDHIRKYIIPTITDDKIPLPEKTKKFFPKYLPYYTRIVLMVLLTVIVGFGLYFIWIGAS